LTEQLIGHLAHTVPVRSSLADDPRLTDLVPRIQDACLEAYEHPHVPFWRIAKHLEWGFTSAFTFHMQVLPVTWPTCQGLVIEPFECAGVGMFAGTTVPTRQFDLAWEIWKKGPALEIVAAFRHDCFSERTVRRLLDEYCEIIARVATRHTQRVSEIAA
jgi:hypothetical protein